jgi:DNA replication and repair protein RecF
MFLKQLHLINFKNYGEAVFRFTRKVTCLVGNNGAGKTNVLDAAHYLSFCKSYFNPIDSQNIMHSSEAFSIIGSYDTAGETEDTVQCVVQRGQRKVFRYNGKDYDRLAEHIGRLPCVMISPYDTHLIEAGSEERRRYMDVVISQYDKLYLEDLIQYNKVIAQRNSYLKQANDTAKFDPSMLEIWDAQLVQYGSRIHEKRTSFINEFTGVFNEFYSQITPDSEEITVNYQSQLTDSGFGELLRQSVQKDRVLRYTSCGVHKDDLIFELSGRPIKRFGSQGQQKSLVVALKLAQFEFIYKIKGFKPVLLLDDVFDKLDRWRIERLMQLVSDDRFGQIIITDTNKERIDLVFSSINADLQIITIDNGEITSDDEKEE